MATTPQPIINTILGDVNAVIPNLQSLVSSYRLLVGAAEEIHRTPNTPPEIFQRALERADRSGTLIDILLELLCCKILFSSEFLSVTCAPVDLFRLLSNRSDATDTPFNTAEQILQLEALRLLMKKFQYKPDSPIPPNKYWENPTPPPSDAANNNGPADADSVTSTESDADNQELPEDFRQEDK